MAEPAESDDAEALVRPAVGMTSEPVPASHVPPARGAAESSGAVAHPPIAPAESDGAGALVGPAVGMTSEPGPATATPVAATRTLSLPPADPVLRAVETWFAAGHVDPLRPIVVACSGGADSLALAAAVWTWAHRGGRGAGAEPRREPTAAVIDHGLQQGSAEIAAAAAAQLRHIGYREAVVRRVEVGAAGGMEAAARDARYAALAEIAAAADPGLGAAVLLAHTADDQAETVLLGLARGSGPTSIAGMRPFAEPWGRPLLAVRRADTENACAAAGLAPWHDPQNADPAFTRARLRAEVVPLLDEVLHGGVVPALARTAELMADDLDALAALADRALAEVVAADGSLDCPALAGWPRAVRRRVLKTWVRQRTGITTLTYRQLVALEGSVIQGHSRQAVRLPGGVDAVRIRTRLYLPHPDVGAATGGWQAGRHDG